MGGDEPGEFPPLLASRELHPMSLEGLHERCVQPFNPAAHRQYLFDCLIRFLRRLDALGIDYTVWIDGSFITQKPEPGDIDLVVLLDAQQVDGLPASIQEEVAALLGEPERTKALYRCHAFPVARSDTENVHSWFDFFTTDRDGAPRGLIALSPEAE